MKTSIKIIMVLLPNLVFGQIDLIPPQDTALIFLPNIVSTKNHEHSSPSINDDSGLMCWSIWERPKPENLRQIIMLMDLKSDNTPYSIDFSDNYSDGGPIWLNEKKILFYSKRPVNKEKSGKAVNDLWIVENYDSLWGLPRCLNFSKHTKYAVTPTITNSGTIYFVGFQDSVENKMGIYLSRLGVDGYEIPEQLPAQINSKHFDWTPYIAGDESYLIFSSNRADCRDKFGDLYISFKDGKNNWGEPINMGNKINTNKQERFPKVSENGKIFFFTRAVDDNNDDIFWIDSKIIDEIRLKQQ